MTAEIRIAGVLIENRVRLNDEQDQGIVGLPSAAWYGEVSTAGIVIEDPDGDFEIEPFSTFTFDETDCTDKPRVFTGWITAKRYRRGKFKQGVGREIDCDIFDQNYLFHLQVFRASSAKRPTETDIVRADFCRNSAPMAFTPLADNGRWNVTDNPIAFGPSDYVTQYPSQLMESIAGISGKNFYAYWDNDAEEISGHYDLVGTNPLSDIRISNVIADSDSDTFYPFLDAELVRTPEKLITGLLYGYLGGNYVFAEDDDLIGPNEFSPVNMKREDVYRTDRVGLASTASAQAIAQLAARAEEVDTIACAITVPSSQVNLLHAGDSADTKFIHLGDTDFVTRDVIRRNVVPHNGRRDKWDIHLQLSNSIKQTGPGGGDPGEGPFEPIECDVDNIAIVQSEHGTLSSPAGNVNVNIAGASWPAPPTEGNVLICAWMTRGSAQGAGGTLPGWTQIGSVQGFAGAGGSGGKIAVWYKIAEASEDTTPTLNSAGGGWSATSLGLSQNYLIEVAGVDTLDTYNQVGSDVESTTWGEDITPTAGTTGIVFTIQEISEQCICTPNNGDVNVLYVEGNISGAGNPGRWIAYTVFDDASGAIDVNRHSTSAHDVSYRQTGIVLICSGGGIPGALMNVKNEHVADGDGTTTTFTTRYPYVAGSLQVFVDGVQIIAGLTESDPDTGEFTLDFAPAAATGDTRAEIVTANYQVSPGS